MKHTHIVFDLDDTLYEEADYVESALKFAAGKIERAYGTACPSDAFIASWRSGEKDVLGRFWVEKDLPEHALPQIVAAMRSHEPKLHLPADSMDALRVVRSDGMGFSILTDGRAITQRMKIAALEVNDATNIYISEERGVKKPDREAFEQIAADHSDEAAFVYIGDNPRKDFVTANKLGWKTVMLNSRGRNIHSQSVDLPEAYHAQHSIDALSDVFEIL